MSLRRRIISGGLLALLFLLIVIGAFANSLSEGGFAAVRLPRASSTLVAFPSITPGSTTTPSPIFTSTPIPSAINCRTPQGWTAITLLPGDTLDSLANSYLSSPNILSEANCLIAVTLVPGTIFFIPALSISPTPSEHFPDECGPLKRWVLYAVQSGDNLYKLSIAYGISIQQLKFANCMGTSTFLRTGVLIYVPNVATRTPLPSSTLVPSKTPNPTKTPTSTYTPSPTSSDTPTATDSPTPTNTPPPTLTPTPTSTPL